MNDSMLILCIQCEIKLFLLDVDDCVHSFSFILVFLVLCNFIRSSVVKGREYFAGRVAYSQTIGKNITSSHKVLN